MDWLSDASKSHKEYVRYVKKMGFTSHAEDLVQEMYLRLHKYEHAIKFNKDGSIPKSYIYRILYNLFIDYKKSSNKFKFVEISECKEIKHESADIDRIMAFDKVVNSVEEGIEKLDPPSKYPYNKELLSLYIESGMSMRQISSLTGISKTSIHWTIKNCREQIKEDVGETLQDYINQDYERI